jgi:hypothetical protein
MPVAVELNGLLPGRGPGRGAPERGPGAAGLGAPGRGAPGPWGLDAAGLAPWSWRPAEPPGRCPGAPPGVLGRGAEGRGWVRWSPPGLRKSAGVAGGRGGPGTRGVPGLSWGRVSAGWETGDGGTGGSRLAAASDTAEAPVAAAPSGAAARSAEPLAVPSGTVLGAAAVPATVARSSRTP